VIGVFKQKNPANILLLLVFGVLIKLPMFLHPHIPVSRPADGLLFHAILKFLEPAGHSSPGLYSFLAFGFLFIQAIVLTSFINTQRMMNRPNYLSGMAYLLITSLLPEWNYFSAPLLINSILLLVLSGLFRIYNQPNAKGTIFNIGLALGIAGFLFVSSLTFIIWILLALAIMRPFRLNEWVLCILGITTPFYFYAIYIFIKGKWSWQYWCSFIGANCLAGCQRFPADGSFLSRWILCAGQSAADADQCKKRLEPFIIILTDGNAAAICEYQ
jgi:hypothetical protein